MMFETLLVANRGEVARRIFRTGRALGLRLVAVYSPQDARAPHVRDADVAVEVPSYLDGAAIVAAALATGAGAVHPGYGFLAEDAAFALRCADAGVVFIGPAPETIETMGSKARAKEIALAAGVPCLPGWQGAEQDDATLIAAAKGLGFPVMIKAAAGGGGRGMRRVEGAADLPTALAAARAEALAGFGDARLILERAISGARHVEVQVLGDAHGTIWALGTRDCSLQRRHQKLIEEAPAPFLPPALVQAMDEAACTLARAVGYVGAGTVEFLVAEGGFHFLEMNTRLQVEHPVTEALYRIDLVDWQIRIARGAALPATPPTPQGHAIEVRLCAEDSDFLPQTGQVALWHAPPGLRVDHALDLGQEIGGTYDSMLAKIVAHAPERDGARAKVMRGLEAMVLEGVVHNAATLGALLALPAFIDGQMSTDTLATWQRPAPLPPAPEVLALAAFLFAARRTNPHQPRFGWTNGPAPALPFVLEVAGQRHAITLHLRRAGDGFALSTPKGEVLLRAAAQGAWRLHFGGQERVYHFAFQGDALFVCGLRITDATHAPPQTRAQAGGGQVSAPMAGRLAAILVAEGDSVAQGQPIALLEAMKMQHPLGAPRAGRVLRILANEGAQLSARQVVAEIGGDE
jgi:geranyl-CoA carboxylase alpha subunit